MHLIRSCLLGTVLFSVCLLEAVPRHEQFADRSGTIAFIEYYIQREVDRQNGEGVGMLVSEDGLVVCLPNVFPDWVPPDWYRDIRLYPAGNPLVEGLEATYLGQDWVTSWHYLRIDDMETASAHLKPVTSYRTGSARIGETLWGVCMTPGDLDYIAYYREGKLSTVQPLPLDTAFATSELAVPGGPVFPCRWNGMSGSGVNFSGPTSAIRTRATCTCSRSLSWRKWANACLKIRSSTSAPGSVFREPSPLTRRQRVSWG